MRTTCCNCVGTKVNDHIPVFIVSMYIRDAATPAIVAIDPKSDIPWQNRVKCLYWPPSLSVGVSTTYSAHVTRDSPKRILVCSLHPTPPILYQLRQVRQSSQQSMLTSIVDSCEGWWKLSAGRVRARDGRGCKDIWKVWASSTAKLISPSDWRYLIAGNAKYGHQNIPTLQIVYYFLCQASFHIRICYSSQSSGLSVDNNLVKVCCIIYMFSNSSISTAQ